jgi:hypothetical protein
MNDLGSEDEPSNGFDEIWREVSSVADSNEDIGEEDVTGIQNVNSEDLDSFDEKLDYFPTPSKMALGEANTTPVPSGKSATGFGSEKGSKSPLGSPKAVKNLPKFMVWKGIWKFVSFLSFSFLLFLLICLDSYLNGSVHNFLAYFVDPTDTALSTASFAPSLINSSQSFPSNESNDESSPLLSGLTVNNSTENKNYVEAYLTISADGTDSPTHNKNSFIADANQFITDAIAGDRGNDHYDECLQDESVVASLSSFSSDSLSSLPMLINDTSSDVSNYIDTAEKRPALGGWLILFLWISFICSALIIVFIQRKSSESSLCEDENNCEEAPPFKEDSIYHDRVKSNQPLISYKTTKAEKCPDSPVSEHDFAGMMHSMSGDETSHSDETTDGPPVAKALYQFNNDYSLRNPRYNLRSSGRKSNNNPYYLRSDDETSVYSDITHDAVVRKAGRYNPDSKQGRKY